LSVGNPEITSPEMPAEGPGSVLTAIPSLRALLTTLKPGSDIPGVPASDINATSLPFLSKLIILGILSSSL